MPGGMAWRAKGSQTAPASGKAKAALECHRRAASGDLDSGLCAKFSPRGITCAR
jgi:hypothetical protein